MSKQPKLDFQNIHLSSHMSLLRAKITLKNNLYHSSLFSVLNDKLVAGVLSFASGYLLLAYAELAKPRTRIFVCRVECLESTRKLGQRAFVDDV